MAVALASIARNCSAMKAMVFIADDHSIADILHTIQAQDSVWA
jgi:hypothetical protein